MDETTKLKRRIQRDGFASLMNDTRWNQLITALVAANLPSKFRVKVIGEAELKARWDSSFPYHLPVPYLHIEWLELSAIFNRPRGSLVPDEVVDRSQELKQILQQTRVPFTLEGNAFRVWGHVRPGLSPQFVSYDV